MILQISVNFLTLKSKALRYCEMLVTTSRQDLTFQKALNLTERCYRVWLKLVRDCFISSSAGVSGTIKTNGHPRQLKLFSKLSSYIMQDDLIQPFLTVQEGMEIAANLKLGDELTSSEKHLAVRQ
jgi:hypothetical protein